MVVHGPTRALVIVGHACFGGYDGRGARRTRRAPLTRRCWPLHVSGAAARVACRPAGVACWPRWREVSLARGARRRQ